MEKVCYYACYHPVGEYYHGEQTQTSMSDLPLQGEKKELWEEQCINLY